MRLITSVILRESCRPNSPFSLQRLYPDAMVLDSVEQLLPKSCMMSSLMQYWFLKLELVHTYC